MSERELKVNGDIKGLLKAMIEVTKEIENIPKNGYNSSMHYSYVLERDVVDTIKKSLANKGIVLIPNIVESSEREVNLKNGKSTISKVIMSYTFFDMNTGGSITTYGAGEGQDSLDKGIYKAITGCQKYMLLKTFLISTGDDPEEENQNNKHSNNQKNDKRKDNNNEISQGDKIPISKAKQLYAMAKGDNNKLNSILNKYNYKTTYDVKVEHFSIIAKELAS